MHKTCFKCGLEQPITEFYRHPMMGDGRLGKCKTCTKRDVSENYRAKRPKYAAYERERNKRPERRKAAMEYAKHQDPQKRLARSLTGSAIKCGRLVPQPCEVCGSKNVQAHHDDYNKPLDVRWLCWVHHMAHHGRMAMTTIGVPQRQVGA